MMAIQELGERSFIRSDSCILARVVRILALSTHAAHVVSASRLGGGLGDERYPGGRA